MVRIAEASRSVRSAIWSSVLLAAVLGVVASGLFQPSPPAQLSATLAIKPLFAEAATATGTEEFVLEGLERPAHFLMVLGSLTDATELTSVRIELLPVHGSSTPAGINRRAGLPWRRNHHDHQPMMSTIAESVRQISYPAVSPEQRPFFVQLGSDPQEKSSYHPVDATLTARSERCRIWIDSACNQQTATSKYDWLLNCLEQQILPRVEALYGKIADLDGDGTVAICLTPRLSELPAWGVPVEGLVQFNDFLPELDRPFSNQADVIFLSPDLTPGPHACAILAHETAHLAVFSRRREANPNLIQPDDDWLNEGLSHVAEIACGGDWSNLGPRIDAFQQRPFHAALLVSDAAQQGLWRDPASRGAAWSFLNWLKEEHGPKVLTELAAHPEIGCPKIEHITGQPFGELFRHWTMAIWQDTNPKMENSSRDRGEENSVGLPVKFLTNTSPREELSLRGSGHQGFRITIAPGERLRVRITTPKVTRLQVSVVDDEVQPPRYWAVK